MRVIYGVLCVVFLLALSVNAWGPKTHKFICEEAVRSVWGVEALADCFPEGEPAEWSRFCVKYVPSLELTWDCLNYSRVYHPAVLGDNLFGDKDEHVDYGKCVIHSTLDANYLCGDMGFRPAMDKALEWFNISEGAESLCQRAYAFCVASNYFADASFPTNRIVGGYKADCASEMEDGVEKKIADKIESWEVNSLCRIPFVKELAGQNQTGKSIQQFRLTEKGIEKIISELSAIGDNISGKEYVTTSSTSTSSSTTTTTSTSTTSTSSTILGEDVFVEEEDNGGLNFKTVFLVLLVIAAIAGAVFYLKKKEGGGSKLHPLLSDSEHNHPTHLERV